MEVIRIEVNETLVKLNRAIVFNGDKITRLAGLIQKGMKGGLVTELPNQMVRVNKGQVMRMRLLREKLARAQILHSTLRSARSEIRSLSRQLAGGLSGERTFAPTQTRNNSNRGQSPMRLTGNEAIVVPLKEDFNPSSVKRFSSFQQAKESAIQLTNEQNQPFCIYTPQLRVEPSRSQGQSRGSEVSLEPEVIRARPDGSWSEQQRHRELEDAHA